MQRNVHFYLTALLATTMFLLKLCIIWESPRYLPLVAVPVVVPAALSDFAETITNDARCPPILGSTIHSKY